MSEQCSKIVTREAWAAIGPTGEYKCREDLTYANPDPSRAMTLDDLERAKAAAAELRPISAGVLSDVCAAVLHNQWHSSVAKVSGEVEALVDSGSNRNA